MSEIFNEDSVVTTVDAILGLVLATIRAEKKITQEQAADCLGVTKAAISNMEKGKSKFAVVQVYQLAAFYGVEPRSVFSALDEALTNDEVKVQALNGTLLTSNNELLESLARAKEGSAAIAYMGGASLNASPSTAGTVLLSTAAFALGGPIVGGVALAGMLGKKFMKKVLESTDNQDNKKAP